MAKYIDCFLYNNEKELLTIRLSLLSNFVERFIVAWSPYTFTGILKSEGFPYELPILKSLGDRVTVIKVESLHGKDAWERESYSRNSLMTGLTGTSLDDIVILSDVDEIPNPIVLDNLSNNSLFERPIVLLQDYFNFKFNYQLVHGREAIWAGPVLQQKKYIKNLQSLRSVRWQLMKEPGRFVENAGWHFSYLTNNDSVRTKLSHFSHQEHKVQIRGKVCIETLIANREGFNDHLHAGSVWAIRELSCFNYRELENLISQYPELLAKEPADSIDSIGNRIKKSIWNLYDNQLHIILQSYSFRELFHEIVIRLKNIIRFK